MKGVKRFSTQAAGMKYFTSLVISAANRGWFRTDEVKRLFQRELDYWSVDYDGSMRGFWGLVCLPILSFFDGVRRGGDSSVDCHFDIDISYQSENDEAVRGYLAWFSSSTEGRFVKLEFAMNGSCWMYYDEGYGYDPKSGEFLEKSNSSFLKLRHLREECADYSSVPRQEFRQMAGVE